MLNFPFFSLAATLLPLSFAIVTWAQPSADGASLKSISDHVEPINPEEPQLVSIPEHER